MKNAQGPKHINMSEYPKLKGIKTAKCFLPLLSFGKLVATIVKSFLIKENVSCTSRVSIMCQ